MEWENIHDEERTFADDNPAQYDQSTAEIAKKIQKADGFVVFLYTRTGENDNGDVTGEGHAAVGATPGLPIYQFLNEAVETINDVLVSMFKSARKEFEEDGKK